MSNHIEEANRPMTVCPRCHGFGSHANPAFDGMSTQELFDDLGYEEADEFLSEYTRRGGMYDVLCEVCGGSNVVRADCECDDCEADRADLAEMYAQEAAERRFGC